MKKLLIAAALVGLSAASALAADLPVQAYTKAPPVVQTTPWTGWYAGINAGYGWNDRDPAFAPNDLAALTLFPPNLGSTLGPSQLRSQGAVGGFQGGYNLQFAPSWVAGIEADFNFSDVKGSSAAASLFAPAAAAPGTNGIFSSSAQLKWFGTLRGRLGFLANDNLLLFGTGGLAYGQVDQSAAYTQTNAAGSIGATNGPIGFRCAIGVPCFAGAQSQTQVGWTAGAGAEWMFWKNQSVKAEYAYINLGSSAYTIIAGNPNPATIPSSIRVANQLDYHIVRAGLNWHF